MAIPLLIPLVVGLAGAGAGYKVASGKDATFGNATQTSVQAQSDADPVQPGAKRKFYTALAVTGSLLLGALYYVNKRSDEPTKGAK